MLGIVLLKGTSDLIIPDDFPVGDTFGKKCR